MPFVPSMGTFLGPDANAQESLRLLDGLVLTSLFEAWPTVILEAFAADVPVFAYDCPSGPREMLGDGVRGCVNRENPEALAEGVVAFFRKDADIRRHQLNEARSYVERFHAMNS